jgi:hypothetical protein
LGCGFSWLVVAGSALMPIEDGDVGVVLLVGWDFAGCFAGRMAFASILLLRSVDSTALRVRDGSGYLPVINALRGMSGKVLSLKTNNFILFLLLSESFF